MHFDYETEEMVQITPRDVYSQEFLNQVKERKDFIIIGFRVPRVGEKFLGINPPSLMAFPYVMVFNCVGDSSLCSNGYKARLIVQSISKKHIEELTCEVPKIVVKRILPSQVYTGKEAVRNVLHAYNMKIIDFRDVVEGETYLGTDYLIYKFSDNYPKNTPRFILKDDKENVDSFWE